VAGDHDKNYLAGTLLLDDLDTKASTLIADARPGVCA